MCLWALWYLPESSHTTHHKLSELQGHSWIFLWLREPLGPMEVCWGGIFRSQHGTLGKPWAWQLPSGMPCGNEGNYFPQLLPGMLPQTRLFSLLYEVSAPWSFLVCTKGVISWIVLDAIYMPPTKASSTILVACCWIWGKAVHLQWRAAGFCLSAFIHSYFHKAVPWL